MENRTKKISRALALFIVMGACWWIGEGFLRLRDEARRASCMPYLLFRACTRCASDHEGRLPPMSSEPGKLFYDVGACEGLTTLGPYDLVCDYDLEGRRDSAFRATMYANPLDDWSYVYLGYFLENESQGLAFAESYRKKVEALGDFEEDLSVPAGQGNLGGDRLRRLQTVETLPAEAEALGERAARIPVVVEWPGNHRELGGHVVFLDGHWEYMLYPGEFPMTEPFIEALRSLDKLGAEQPQAVEDDEEGRAHVGGDGHP